MDMNMIILREFVLKSGHIMKVMMIKSAPISDNEAAVVVKILLRFDSAISVWGPYVIG